jgi:hypothetical protein
MKAFLAALLATILAVATGAGIAALRITVCPWNRGDVEGAGLVPPPVPPTDGTAPKVVVDQEEYEFGKMDLACGCTVSKIEQETIAPGESGKVSLTWRADKGEGPFRQTATIETNDPSRPRVVLTVWGRVLRVVRLVPDELVFGQISAGRPVTGQVRLLCRLDEPLEGVRCDLREEQTAGHFGIVAEPLSADQLKEPDQGNGGSGEGGGSEKAGNIDESDRPRSGYLLTVTVKPGLPLGRFRQTIVVHTSLKSVPTVQIPVVGTVVGDISIVGRGWDEEASLLTLGRVSSLRGIQRRLLLIARGPHSKEVQFTLVGASPDWLQVDQERLKETTPFGSGTVTETPLVIRIPKGAPRANYLGSKFGEILIRTNHPDVPRLRIRVHFAVEG